MSRPPVILVVDDEAHITHVVSLKLSNAGYDVHTAADGEEALEVALSVTPDIIITDLQMPYMNGLELCAKLKERPTTRNLPVILLTARGHALNEEEMKQTNIRQVMSKPFSPRQILDSVEALLKEHKIEDEDSLAA